MRAWWVVTVVCLGGLAGCGEPGEAPTESGPLPESFAELREDARTHAESLREHEAAGPAARRIVEGLEAIGAVADGVRVVADAEAPLPQETSREIAEELATRERAFREEARTLEAALGKMDGQARADARRVTESLVRLAGMLGSSRERFTAAKLHEADPAKLVESDVEKLVESPHLVARKFPAASDVADHIERIWAAGAKIHRRTKHLSHC